MLTVAKQFVTARLTRFAIGLEGELPAQDHTHGQQLLIEGTSALVTHSHARAKYEKVRTHLLSSVMDAMLCSIVLQPA
jgi:hypothetical protein